MANIERLKYEYHMKNRILSMSFGEVSQEDCYKTIFGDLDRTFIYLTVTAPKGERLHKTKDFQEICDVGRERSDLYLPLAEFFNDYYKKATMKAIYAFFVDLDKISANALNVLIESVLPKLSLLPTLIHNSGGGVHLIWALSEPLQTFKSRIPFIESVNKALQDLFEESSASLGFKLDRRGIMQPYRFVGSCSKIGEKTQGYKIGRNYDISELSEWLGVKEKGDTEKSNRDQKLKKGNGKVAKSTPYLIDTTTEPNGRPAFYEYCLRRIENDVKQGHRWKSLCALAIVAWKSRVPKMKLEIDAWKLFGHFNRQPHDHLLKKTDVEFALQNYKPASTKVSAKRLEELFGFKFERTTKRNGRTKSEHSAYMNESKKERKKERMEKVLSFIQQDNNVSFSRIADITGLSRQTVSKYIKDYQSVRMS